MKPLVSVASLILKDEQGQILLGKRASVSIYDPCRWDLPGGKVESEGFEQAALRELEEEFGLKHCGPLKVVGTYHFEYPDRQVEVCYLRGAWRGGAAVIRNEAREFSESAFIPPALIFGLDLAFSHRAVLQQVLPLLATLSDDECE
jgi:8-oxo-dGTP pyrophosphatase MutT (NUDIX family)